MDYEVVIGLEVHNELKTKTKIFCSCINQFGGEPNTHCCPICSGHPGTLPKLNRQAVLYSVKAGLALNCEIQKVSKFDRKNYYYPDLPKAYQTSQFEMPICTNGRLDFNVNGEQKSVRINRIHIEEDAGKLIHSEWGNGTLVDYNRGGVPLIEIVTEPDLRSPEEAVAFLETIRSVLKYADVSDCRMEEGSLRCDVNLSLMKKGDTKYGTRTEMKNLNSFKAAYKAMQYEIKRQKEILESGGAVMQETRRWDDAKGKSYPMRSKEDAHDYRYFPEPDLVPVILTDKEIEEIRATVPELPLQKKKRYMAEYNLPEYDADVLTVDKEIAQFFDACSSLYENKKALSNWIMGDVMRKLKEDKIEDIFIPITPANFVKLLNLYDSNVISQSGAKTVFEKLWEQDADPEVLVEKLSLKQISDSGKLLNIVKEIVSKNPQPAQDYRNGNKKAIAFFVGQIMKETKGKANPKLVNELLSKELDN